MSQSDKYRDIYNKEIICKGRGIVFSYEPFSDKFVFAPFSHNVGETAIEDLGELMRHNLFFYAFGENEVVKYTILPIRDAVERYYEKQLEMARLA